MRLQLRRLARHWARNRVVTGVFLLLLILASSVSVMFAEHIRNADEVYAEYYDVTNLGDLFATGPDGFTYDAERLERACTSTPDTSGLAVESCETRMVVRGEYTHSEAQRTFLAEADGCSSLAACDDDILTTATMIVHGMEVTDDGLGRINRPYVAEGWGRHAEGPNEVVLDHVVADETGVALGDTVTFVLNGTSFDFDIVGFASQPDHAFYVPSADVLVPVPGSLVAAYMNRTALLEHLGEGPEVRNRLLVDVGGTPTYDLPETPEREGKALAGLAEALAASLESEGLSTMRVGDRTTLFGVEFLRIDLEGNRTMQPVMLGMLVSVSALVLAVSLERLVRRQRREIAVLRSLGTPSRTLLVAYLLPPVIMGLLASLVGVALGTQMTEAFTPYYFSIIGSVPVIDVVHDPAVWATTVASVMAIVVVFTLWPAWSAVRMSPLEIDRRDAGERPGALVHWLSSALPSSLALGARAMFRHPMRLTVTVVGLGMAMILSSGFALLVTSMEGSFIEAQEADTWQYAIAYNPFDAEPVDAWLDSEGTGWDTERALTVPDINATGDTRAMTLHARTAFGTDAADAMHLTRLVEGRLPVAGAEVPEAMVDVGAAALLEWSVGDRVEVLVGVTVLDVEIVGIADEFERSLWTHHEDVAEDIGMAGLYNMVMLRSDDTTLAAPSNIAGAAVLDQQAIREGFADGWEQQSQILNVFIGVGLLIAGVILLNTLIINLTEHDAEYATLRILGASTPRMGAILTVEHVIIGALAALSGSLFSVWAAKAMMVSFSTWSFYFALDLDLSVVVRYALILFVAAQAMTLVGLRRLRHMDLVERSKSFGQ